MEFKKLTEKRFSFRGYEAREVEKEKLEYILEACRLAPSAANRQPWKIYIVTDEKVRGDLSKSYERDWFAEAPVHVAFVGLPDENWKRGDGEDYLLCDVTIIADYFILAAAEQGLGTCYIAAFDEKKAADALRLGDNEKVLLLTPLGYPKRDVTRERKRKELVDIVKYI